MKRDQKKLASAIVIGFLGFMLITQLYLFIAVQDLQSDQEDMVESMSELRTSYKEDLESVRNSYDARLERMGDFVLETRNDYKNKTRDLLNMIEETEKENDVQLKELREEVQDLSQGDFTDLAEKVKKASVSIKTNSSRGSGAVISGEGYIVTNNHVVRGYDSVQITNNEEETGTATVIAHNATRDLAILDPDMSFSTHLELADSDEVLVGERVIGIGSPKDLDMTITQGIVSATDRVFREDEGSFIQTDVPINSGSSGGALVNADGKLIGINTFKIKGSESLGFAIPSNDIKKLLEQADSNTTAS